MSNRDTEYDHVDLGDRYAIMARKTGGDWAALYYVTTRKDAESFVELCRSRGKEGAEAVLSAKIGRPVHWRRQRERKDEP